MICANNKNSKTHLVISSWISENIFDFRKGDSIAYFALYVLVPVIITWVSLKTLSTDDVSIIYCYMTILISALNSIYDGANRWNSKYKSIRNARIGRV